MDENYLNEANYSDYIFEGNPLEQSMLILERESASALDSAKVANDFTLSTRFPEEEEWRIEWNKGDPASEPIPRRLQIEILEYRTQVLEEQLQEKKELIHQLNESMAILRTMAAAHTRIKILALFGIFVFAFALAIHLIAGVFLANPIFSIFGMFSCSVFWLMAKFGGHYTQKK
jgi:hypothetical protein